MYNLFVLDMLINQFNPSIQIEQAMNGQEAVDKVLARSRPFDIIFLDLHMPVLDGFKVGYVILTLVNRLLSSSESIIEIRE